MTSIEFSSKSYNKDQIIGSSWFIYFSSFATIFSSFFSPSLIPGLLSNSISTPTPPFTTHSAQSLLPPGRYCERSLHTNTGIKRSRLGIWGEYRDLFCFKLYKTKYTSEMNMPQVETDLWTYLLFFYWNYPLC